MKPRNLMGWLPKKAADWRKNKDWGSSTKLRTPRGKSTPAKIEPTELTISAARAMPWLHEGATKWFHNPSWNLTGIWNRSTSGSNRQKGGIYQVGQIERSRNRRQRWPKFRVKIKSLPVIHDDRQEHRRCNTWQFIIVAYACETPAASTTAVL
jgi:hypothetical protein